MGGALGLPGEQYPEEKSKYFQKVLNFFVDDGVGVTSMLDNLVFVCEKNIGGEIWSLFVFFLCAGQYA
jgi:hypothetical protein